MHWSSSSRSSSVSLAVPTPVVAGRIQRDHCVNVAEHRPPDRARALRGEVERHAEPEQAIDGSCLGLLTPLCPSDGETRAADSCTYIYRRQGEIFSDGL